MIPCIYHVTFWIHNITNLAFYTFLSHLQRFPSHTTSPFFIFSFPQISHTAIEQSSVKKYIPCLKISPIQLNFSLVHILIHSTMTCLLAKLIPTTAHSHSRICSSHTHANHISLIQTNYKKISKQKITRFLRSKPVQNTTIPYTACKQWNRKFFHIFSKYLKESLLTTSRIEESRLK